MQNGTFTKSSPVLRSMEKITHCGWRSPNGMASFELSHRGFAGQPFDGTQCGRNMTQQRQNYVTISFPSRQVMACSPHLTGFKASGRKLCIFIKTTPYCRRLRTHAPCSGFQVSVSNPTRRMELVAGYLGPADGVKRIGDCGAAD